MECKDRGNETEELCNGGSADGASSWVCLALYRAIRSVRLGEKYGLAPTIISVGVCTIGSKIKPFSCYAGVLQKTI